MKTEMKELDLNELDQANGGFVWAIPYVVAAAVGIAAVVKTVKVLKDR